MVVAENEDGRKFNQALEALKAMSGNSNALSGLANLVPILSPHATHSSLHRTLLCGLPPSCPPASAAASPPVLQTDWPPFRSDQPRLQPPRREATETQISLHVHRLLAHAHPQ